MSRRIWAWMVTSRAVVGSSARMRSGSQARAMAMTTRWRMPPGKFVGIALQALGSVGDADQMEQFGGGLQGLALGQSAVQTDGLGHLLAHGKDRVERGHGFLKDHGNLVAAYRAHGGFGQGEQVAALEQHLAAHDARGRFRRKAQNG